MELIGVSKWYGLRRPWVAHDADLTLGPGMLVRVVGDNGSGKSTLLRLIAGYRSPAALTGLPGVLAVDAIPGGLAVQVDPGCSDDVLRHLLGERRAHVLRVLPLTPEGR